MQFLELLFKETVCILVVVFLVVMFTGCGSGPMVKHVTKEPQGYMCVAIEGIGLRCVHSDETKQDVYPPAWFGFEELFTGKLICVEQGYLGGMMIHHDSLHKALE
jgi:hypothetical protein